MTEHGLSADRTHAAAPAVGEPCAEGVGLAEVRRQFPIAEAQVPLVGGGCARLVYLDHAASTHPPAVVLDAYVDFLRLEYANVHRATHLLSRRATERFEESARTVAEFLGADMSHGCVVFTANASQAIDLASHAMAHRPGRVVTTELEHHSNELPHRRRGPVHRVRMRPDGTLDLEHLEALLRVGDVKLVCVTAASNVTGYVPDLAAVARLVHAHGARLLVDAAQALAHVPLRVGSPDDPEHLDFVAASGHKAYAPFGAGLLWGPRDVLDEAPPYLPAGGTAARVTEDEVEYLPAPDRHQGGTPNVAGVVGMATALRWLRGLGMEAVRAHERRLLEKAIAELSRIDGVRLYGPGETAWRVGIVCFNVEGVDDSLTAAVLSDEHAIAVRNGRFCAHLHVERLLAAAHPDPHARPRGAVRASFGLYNDESDVERLIEAVRLVRDRRWRGRYRVRQMAPSAEVAGRCADRWMEAEADSSSSPPTG
ncbi:MAG: aminotransferase class V-fold PLP-dependent enzyme [Myxococcota bacterium]|nr:aminotransferase class V-fold PLP-dependent enzyme [Myxococcota bacterium]MDW8362938.1 aminotransferase class V-fold PLP-dependent enzyme [Myxococcales bacterium]